jgi:hypothetical protein
MGFDFVLGRRSKLDINGTLSLEYTNSIFVLYLIERPERQGFEAYEVELLMDNGSCHLSDYVLALLTRERVRILTFDTHTTHIFQILDLVLFGVLKKHVTNLGTLADGNQRPHSCLKSIATSRGQWGKSIWNISVAIRFIHDIDQIPYGLLFDEEQSEHSHRFVDRWELNDPLESLLKRRRDTKFEWVNKPK